VRAWLRSGPSLDDLIAAYPAHWRAVQRTVAPMLARRDADEIKAYVLSHEQRRRRRVPQEAGLTDLDVQLRDRMTTLAVRQVMVSISSGVECGRVRFNLVNGFVTQRLLFEQDLRRKPVSMRWFRTIWPMLPQRRILMPLVQPQGIYCFYSGALVERLTALIGDRPCLEIAAGDGTLTRFLAAAGVEVTATDDGSWSHSVRCGEDVERQDARRALHRRRPSVVICSWPPAGNNFERHVFSTPSVQLYVVIGTRHAFGAGDWTAYRRQQDFDMVLDEDLSRLVLPPELNPAVHVFRRR
jgi:hypothetical protein